MDSSGEARWVFYIVLSTYCTEQHRLHDGCSLHNISSIDSCCGSSLEAQHTCSPHFWTPSKIQNDGLTRTIESTSESKQSNMARHASKSATAKQNQGVTTNICVAVDDCNELAEIDCDLQTKILEQCEVARMAVTETPSTNPTPAPSSIPPGAYAVVPTRQDATDYEERSNESIHDTTETVSAEGNGDLNLIEEAFLVVEAGDVETGHEKPRKKWRKSPKKKCWMESLYNHPVHTKILM